jgi:hypothetical protein
MSKVLSSPHAGNQREDEENPLAKPASPEEMQQFWASAEKDWLAQQDNRPLDPTPLGVHAKRMVANGYDGSGLREKSPAEVLEFINDPRHRSWTEFELSVPQRRYWAAIRSAYRKFLSDRS